MQPARRTAESPTRRTDRAGFARTPAPRHRPATEELKGLFSRTLERIALRRVLPEKLHCENGVLRVGEETIELERYDRLWAVAFGKAGFQMAEIFAEILSPWPLSGIVSGTAEGTRTLFGFSCFRGGHPYPNEDTFRAGEAVLDLLDQVGPNDLVIYLLSGGGSAICEKPLFPEINLEDCCLFYERLITCGANIVDVNFIRKHFSAIKGGRLTERAWPARQITLYVSDAPPDSASNVASGPTMPDESSVSNCYAILDELGIVPRLPRSIRRLIEDRQIPETPKPGSTVFQTSSWHCLLSPEEAVEALSTEALRCDFHTVIDWSVNDDTPLDEATGRLIARVEALQSAHPGKTVAVVTGGEFSCPVEGRGVGGRNQAFVLDCIPKIAGKNIAVLSAGTDGVDGISPAAGAVADGDSLRRARRIGLDVSDYARRSDSHSFFARLGDAITTGPTGNNVRDLRILVGWPQHVETFHQGELQMRTAIKTAPASSFCHGVRFFGAPRPGFDVHAQAAAIADARTAIADPADPDAVYQTLLAADALRYLTLQMTASKRSGHPGGFASVAEALAALVMEGHTAVLTEAGHHAPGFYATAFLDTSLEAIGIDNVEKLCQRFRERGGLLGHPSAHIPGILAPAGPLGQGQHFAMAAALLNPGVLFPFTVGDGGLGEPYVLSSMMHFHTSYPKTTNFLPVLVWNGYSQEHHSMVSSLTNRAMIALWESHGFDEVVLVDAKEHDDCGQDGPFVDSTVFSFGGRLGFTRATLEGVHRAAEAALSGKLAAVVIKQIKGAGTHALGSESHALTPKDGLDEPHILSSLERVALSYDEWHIVRANFARAGGGPQSKNRYHCDPEPIRDLPRVEFPRGEKHVPTTAMGNLVAVVGKLDPGLVVANADGNQASGMMEINKALIIRHPVEDDLYRQGPEGHVYEPVSEDACAGLTAGLAHFGGRSLWLSYESFAINGLPVWQTATQALAELPYRVPSAVAMFTAGALEQGRNGWTHQRPEIENYVAAMMKNGNVFPLFPSDANGIQAAYEWALSSSNKGVVIFASKTPLPVYADYESGRRAVEEGAVQLYESEGGDRDVVVLAVAGDFMLGPVFEAKERLEGAGFRVRIVSVVSPRRLYRPSDIAWRTATAPDGKFMDDGAFSALFDGDVLLGVTGGGSAILEPLLLRSKSPRRDLLSWRRGDTVASADELLESNGLDARNIVRRVESLTA